jgi:hypothetical protein
MSRHIPLEEFVVVVIDDKDESCRRVCDAIRGDRTLDGRPVRVIAHSVLIKVTELARADDLNGKFWTFEAAVSQQLARAAETRPDMIIVDFVYIDPAIQKNIMSHIDKSGTAPDNTRDLYLNPRDLRVWIETCNTIDATIRKAIIKNIFDAGVPTYLHTYTPEALEDATGLPSVRKGIADFAFPKARNMVELVDTRQIFYAGNTFDRDKATTRHTSEHYGHLLGLHFSHLVDKQIYRNRLHRQKYLRVRNSSAAIATIVGVGTAFAAATSFVGGIVFNYLDRGYFGEAIAIFMISLLASAIFGGALGLFFERLMKNLLPPSARDS